MVLPVKNMRTASNAMVKETETAITFSVLFNCIFINAVFWEER